MTKMSLGLAAVPILMVIFNAVKILLDWKIFLALALIAPMHHFIQ